MLLIFGNFAKVAPADLDFASISTSKGVAAGFFLQPEPHAFFLRRALARPLRG
jgi:hypothetical protein